MSVQSSPRRALSVLAAATVILLLGGSLAIRLLSGDHWPFPATHLIAPSAFVSDPSAVDIRSLKMPQWSSPEAWQRPLRFQTDLDALAPLGTGSANAAVWFKDFSKPVGPRLPEFEEAQKRSLDHPTLGHVLPANDPLLLEAQPWCGQATMRFYPDFLALKGQMTPIPNLILPILLAKSWVARGMDATDDASAFADFRRAIRLGRLLRQEDVTVIQDLVGLACIRIGIEAIYNRARFAGDANIALVAAVAFSEAAPQKLLTQALLTDVVEVFAHIRGNPSGQVQLAVLDSTLKELIERAMTSKDRRFRFEAINALGVVRFWGRASQQELALRTLDDLAANTDPITAAFARNSRDVQLPTADLLKIAEGFK